MKYHQEISTLYFLNPETFEQVGQIKIYDNNGPVKYLNELELGRLPADATRLFFLTLSFAEIAPFIECYKGNPRVANSFEETRFVALHADRPA